MKILLVGIYDYSCSCTACVLDTDSGKMERIKLDPYCYDVVRDIRFICDDNGAFDYDQFVNSITLYSYDSEEARLLKIGFVTKLSKEYDKVIVNEDGTYDDLQIKQAIENAKNRGSGC